MKSILSLLLVTMLVFSLCACSIDDTPGKEYVSPTENATENKQESNTEESKDETFGLNETAVFKELKVTATELQESEGEDFFEPKDGNVFVGIKFTIENTSDKAQSVSSLMMFNAYLDDIKCEYSLSASCVFDEGTLDGEVAPGKKLVGWYALEVPENWTSIEINVKPNLLSDSFANFIFSK